MFFLENCSEKLISNLIFYSDLFSIEKRDSSLSWEGIKIKPNCSSITFLLDFFQPRRRNSHRLPTLTSVVKVALRTSKTRHRTFL